GGWGWDNFLAEADTGKGVRFPRWSKLWLKFGIPALILMIFVMGYVPKITVWLGMA
ncbi:MAG TPA: sodium-dependent transporter, partial [Gordonibacter urolithinfaciens]|nr:sodium-dependent transporter [Gordonibacter urolithinfaciens]